MRYTLDFWSSKGWFLQGRLKAFIVQQASVFRLLFLSLNVVPLAGKQVPASQERCFAFVLAFLFGSHFV